MSEAATAFAGLSDVEQVKSILKVGIDECIRRNFKTVQAAADKLDVNPEQLYRVRNLSDDRHSIPWLLNVAQRLGVKVVIHVELT